MSDLILKLGKNVKICDTAKLDKRGTLIIGDNVYISHNTYIQTHYHEIKDYVQWRERAPITTTLEIGNNAYVGYGAIILPQVKNIGEGAIIGAMAVVTKDVEPWTIVAGNPARVVRKRNPKDR